MLRLLDARLGRHVRSLPTAPAAQQRGRVFNALFVEIQHRTGACMLFYSGTVGDQELVFRQLLQPRRNLAQRDVDGAFDVLQIVLVFAADVDVDGLLRRDQLDGFVAGDAAGRLERVL